jgi:hypothetical protein
MLGQQSLRAGVGQRRDASQRDGQSRAEANNAKR